MLKSKVWLIIKSIDTFADNSPTVEQNNVQHISNHIADSGHTQQ